CGQPRSPCCSSSTSSSADTSRAAAVPAHLTNGEPLMTLETTTIQPFPAQRTARVTGGGAPRGSGRRVVRNLVSAGGNAAAADIDGAAVEESAAELNAERPAESGLKVIGVGVDISDQDSVDAAFERVDAEMPQLAA